MRIFGITGGSGTGKSTVSEELRKNGIYIIDADKTARKVTEKGSACLCELCEEYGKEILESDGSLNRKALGDIVFNDSEKLKTLNRITHKYITEDIKNELNASGAEIAAVDAAALIGSPLEEMCEFILLVWADYDVRLSRIKVRDSLDDGRAVSRLSSQPDFEFYKAKCSHIIYNSGSYEELKEEVDKFLNNIKRGSNE